MSHASSKTVGDKAEPTNDKLNEETRSLQTRSRESGSSLSSNAMLAVARARAKAEAAEARASYTQREIALKVEQARIQATLEALQVEKERDAAKAELETLEAGLVESDLRSAAKKPIPLSPLKRLQHTEEYVKEQSRIKSSHHSNMDEAPFHTPYVTRQWQTGLPRDDQGSLPIKNKHGVSHIGEQPSNQHQSSTHPHGAFGINPRISEYDRTPTNHDLAKCLARNQLLTTGLSTFDDKPENYWAWKSSFKSAIAGLDLTAGEELDLLSRWLGRESSEHVRRLKAANIRCPPAGLSMAWERLEETYGSPEAIERALFSKLERFPKLTNKEPQKLRELGDLLLEVKAAKLDGYLPGLAYLDTSRGVHPIAEKLPYNLQERWMSYGSRYKRDNNVSFPPFPVFVDFVRTEAMTRTDPSFNFAVSQAPSEPRKGSDRFTRASVSVNKTTVFPSKEYGGTNKSVNDNKLCPIHGKPHPLKKCRSFREKTIEDRKQFLKDHSICFRCCSSTEHLARDCKAEVQCGECQSDRHPSALHPGPPQWTSRPFTSSPEHGGEEDKVTEDVTAKCTEVCGRGVSARACSKICLVSVYPEGHHEKSTKVYAILDEQSNKSLARSEFFSVFNIQGGEFPYTLKTCAGLKETTGRRAHGYVIESIDQKISLRLPTLIECNQIPNNRSEIPTPDAALHHNHLRKMADEIPSLDPQAEILLLLGRDILRVHKIRKQINGPHNAPFAQKLDLGWVVIGDVCLGGAHKPSVVSTLKTAILENGRPSYLQPCGSQVQVKERFGHDTMHQAFPVTSSDSSPSTIDEENLGQFIFRRTPSDHKLAPSIDDTRFLRIMDSEVHQDNSNSWVAPLPFKTPRQRLPNNRDCAYNRLISLRRTLEKRPQMKTHFLEFIEKLFKNEHAEVAPPLQEGQEVWYLPSFGVYHPKKPEQIRVVFDSSAAYQGVSLNNVLLRGPDLNNTLIGVLMRFRKDLVAITADVQHMFHCFVVKKEHRDFLRFLWYRNNDLDSDIVEYRMRVHVFGNSPSPAVAIYGLRRAAREEENDFGGDARRLVEREFYVDDLLKSCPTEGEAISVLKRAQEMLAVSNLRLHKVASNRQAVIDAFSPEDRAKDIQERNLFSDDMPLQRTLGVTWSITADTFMFQVAAEQKPFTRRGVLSTVNSIYDPLGFLTPVTIQGRLLLRELSIQAEEWDSPLPKGMEVDWDRWRESLQDLKDLKIPRAYTTISSPNAQRRELCIFADASVKAVSAVAYLKVTNNDGRVEVGFVFGKARLAPKPDLSIPRLELCAAVLAVEMADMIVEEMDLKFDSIEYYTDSKVVLGYIHNQSRRFYVYVNNRVQQIRQSSAPEQWQYVSTDHNPADHGTRSVPASLLGSTTWLTGPAFLRNPSSPKPERQEIYDLVDSISDSEVRPQVVVNITNIKKDTLNTARFERFSDFDTLIKAVGHLVHIASSFSQARQVDTCHGWHICHKGLSNGETEKAKILVIKSVQRECYAEEFRCIETSGNLPINSSLQKLHPFVDSTGILRVGGRIKESQLSTDETNPIIIPGHHHLGTLIVRHHHHAVKHQGRHFTEGAVRASGIWLVRAKRSISSLLSKCVTCRRLRGKTEHQQMADLPAERLQAAPPFSYVGVDVFGPWEVVSRRTRGGQVNSKRWAVLFSCMCTRAVHIEIIEAMSASSFINALRRFFAIRGPAKQLRSDCGTNFIGACRELGMDGSLPDPHGVEKFLEAQKCIWVFNPPHSSHMGGVWERMIGIARRILDCMLLEDKSRLTHEVLTTLMAEVSAIMNARPLIPVSSDPEAPVILSPLMLLTQKVGAPPTPPSDFKKGELLKAEWKRVQSLANTFWTRWRREYLSTLQVRHKWVNKRPNLKQGDVVLMKDAQAKRNDWPTAVVTKAFPSQDGLVRKVDVRVIKEGKPKVYSRPATEVVLLLSPEDSQD
ncbi:uncharacterized protein LOC117549272 [Gymnodraco acuticeps]|uniref:Uncharacterized protein LOC117549272 n=1 Tax=Gymnodraco acuticeps TaxID=8218 RepID=A0A6P8VK93_GYMAC|nr:uncharacterized protein LOC117549272 [Gymnodraco acuticeps]